MDVFLTEDKCPHGEHKCKKSGRCIMREWVCDGVIDCGDWDDESQCCEYHRYHGTLLPCYLIDIYLCFVPLLLAVVSARFLVSSTKLYPPLFDGTAPPSSPPVVYYLYYFNFKKILTPFCFYFISLILSIGFVPLFNPCFLFFR